MTQTKQAVPGAERQQAPLEMVAQLRQLIRNNCRRWKALILLEAVGLGIAAPLAYLWLVVFLDIQWHLSLVGRVLASLGLLAGLGWAAVHLLRRWRQLNFTEDQVALAIERGTPGGVQNRLINAMQIARAEHTAAPDLAEAVVGENCQRLRQIHLQQAATMRPAMLRMGIALAVVMVGIGFWSALPDQFANAAKRIFLPLASIDPLFRTKLTVEPVQPTVADPALFQEKRVQTLQTAGDVTIRILIEGKRPESLTLFKNVEGKTSAETILVDSGSDSITYTFRGVAQSLKYILRGGDFTSAEYHILLPQKASLSGVRVVYRFPEYTGLGSKTVESQSGDLEGLPQTSAEVSFAFDHPLDSAHVVLQGKKQSLNKTGPTEFTGTIVLGGASGYRLETVQGERKASTPYSIRVLKDLQPKLELVGLERRLEAQIDGTLPLHISASDDYGLEKVGLFFRPISLDAVAEKTEDDGWQELIVWPAQRKAVFKLNHDLAIASLKMVEGERVELALRGADTDPLRKGTWTTGPVHEITVDGDGVGLQRQYEQIVRSQKEIKELIGKQREVLGQTNQWLGKLDGGDLRWDDPKNIDALHAAIKSLRQEQEKLRKSAGGTARAMVGSAGNLRLSVNMLAETETALLTRIFDSVPSRDKPQDKRAALADARITQERTIRSLEEMLEQYVLFRSDWELNHMIPFTKMLAERESKLRNQSQKQASKASGKLEESLRVSMERRQLKVLELCKLIQPAFTGLASRLESQQPDLAKAFQSGAGILGGEPLQQPMMRAAAAAKAGQWQDAVQHQTTAAEQLTALHDQLFKAQTDAAQKVLAALKEKMKSDLQAQKELEKLAPGTADAFLKDFTGLLTIEDLMRIQDVVGSVKSKGSGEQPDFKNSPLLEVDRKTIELDKDSGVRQDPYTLKLGKVAEKTPILKMYKGDEGNKVKPFVQEKFDDLVGKLLDETEELHKDFQSIKLNTNQNNNDPGEVSKVGGALNSTGAVTATGNKRPPTTESGGLSKTGRLGARATGQIADDEGVDRRGRDKALDGQQRVADQAGIQKMTKSDDMQKNGSTGVGGKKVESDNTTFSLHDAGKWSDEFAKRMDKAQAKHNIVERQGDKMDAKTAAMMRDLTSKQEQVIERLKAIKKELRNLYLPTEHIDELSAALEANRVSLKEQPDADTFRLQLQTLDRLRGSLLVFRGANAGFEPSLPRERALQGRVLDERGAPGMPGYEDAVRQYYLKLAEQ